MQATLNFGRRRPIAACGPIIDAKDKYFIEAVKFKGPILLRIGEYVDAQALYQSVLDMRPIGWAQLGLAR